MKYFEIQLDVTPHSEEACDVLAAMLADAGCDSFLPTSTGLSAYMPQRLFSQEAIDHCLATFPLPGHHIDCRVEEAPDEDWNATWEQEGFEPIVLGDLLCVHDTRHTQLPHCRYDIVINPRMAFGTGTHPTTQQILQHLCQTDVAGLNIVDAGCGTGVLGILCAMRGAAKVFAYDIDPWSVENTRINASLNNVHCISVQEGDSAVLPQDGTCDMLIANINRNILLADMPRFAQAIRKGGSLLVSGFYEADLPLLIATAAPLGLQPHATSVREGWAMLHLRHVGTD